MPATLTRATPYLQTEEGWLQLYTRLEHVDLSAVAMNGREAISELFWFDLDLISTRENIQASDLIGEPLTVGVPTRSQLALRYINGYVSEFTVVSRTSRCNRYRVRIVPWLWFLTRTTDCAIYQDASLGGIIRDLLERAGRKDFKFKLRGCDDTVRAYCVQYRETSCAFLMRLMEEHGVAFYFEHAQDHHTLILTDARSHPNCPVNDCFKWDPGDDDELEGCVHEWNHRVEAGPHQWTMADFDYYSEANRYLASQPDISSTAVPNSERFDYPAKLFSYRGAEANTSVRMQEEKAGLDVITGASTAPELTSGCRFDLSDHYRRDENGTYVLTAVEHSVSNAGWYSNQESEPATYRNRFTCIPYGVQFRPPRRTPKPVIAGPQTAFVVGPDGKEIYTDDYGRVKVQFHWDRRGELDQHSSCWVRVAQTLAGSGWGSMHIPRIGHEVIVEFLNGDPDYPLITGSMYHSAHRPPYGADENTKTTIKTLSTPGGGGFNELRFEDAKDKEQVFIHAQRNFDLRILNDRFTTVKGDSHLTTGKDQLTKIGANQHLTVERDQNQKVGGTISISAGVNWQQKVGNRFAAEAGEEIYLKSGTNVVVESGTALTLKVGGNFIEIGPEGIFIQGTMVMINSGGMSGTGVPASPDTPQEPQEADTAMAGEHLGSGKRPEPPAKPIKWSEQAAQLRNAREQSEPYVLVPNPPGYKEVADEGSDAEEDAIVERVQNDADPDIESDSDDEENGAESEDLLAEGIRSYISPVYEPSEPRQKRGKN